MISETAKAFYYPTWLFVLGWIVGGARQFLWLFKGGPEPGINWSLAWICWGAALIMLCFLAFAAIQETTARTTRRRAFTRDSKYAQTRDHNELLDEGVTDEMVS
jgi:hypothetical protein